jgi:FkbM family methyltransferase
LSLLEIEGFKIYASALDFEVSRQLLTAGVTEGLTTGLFRQELKRGMAVVDIGASSGYFTFLAASIVGEEGRVFAFEPDRGRFEMLLKGIDVNGFRNVLAVRKAVFKKTGKLKLSLGPESRSRVVDAVSLDDFLADWDGKIDFIKMDIDGGEPFALEGMNKVFKNNPGLRMIAEYDPASLQRFGNSPTAYLKRITDSGLEIRAIYDEIRKRCISPADPDSILSIKDCANLFLLRSAT